MSIILSFRAAVIFFISCSAVIWEDKRTMNDLLQLPGSTEFKILRTIQDNQRYKVCEIEQDGEVRILKVCNDKKLQPMLLRDVQSSFYLETVRSYNIESVFRVRKIYSYGDNWYIAEKLSGKILYPKKPLAESNRDRRVASELYAPFQYEVNIYTPQVMLGKNIFSDSHDNPNDAYYEALQVFDDWARIAVQGDFIHESLVKDIRTFLASHLTEVCYGIELYDLEPWEMFILPDYKIGVIDLEYLNLRGRRHFDVAYNYLRLWFDCHAPSIATSMLRRYVEICGEEKMDGAFLSLFGFKLMGYLRDAATWMKDTIAQGKPVIYNHEQANAILERYQHFSIDRLIED